MGNKLLVVIDYQNDFVDGSLGFPGAEKLDKGIAEKVRNHEGALVYTLDTHEENYLETREGKKLPFKHCISETEGHNLYGETGKAIESKKELNGNLIHCIKKQSFGVGPRRMLEVANQIGEVGEIELVGLVTNICVVSNAVTFQAAYPEAKIVVDASLCASFDAELHEKTLDVLEGLQVEVINR